MEGRIFKWGIIGLGKIARKFADDLKTIPHAQLHAVASTDLSRAETFAAEYGALHALGSYEAIGSVTDLDVVYIATPHIHHHATTMYCLAHGLPVLCEKPFAMTAQEAHEMVALARSNKVFAMEALWTCFIPAFERVLETIRQGTIGDIHTVEADFGFNMPVNPESRLFNKALGGGALLDIGIYPMFLALQLFGKPDPKDVFAMATISETDVDDNTAFMFRYTSKRMAMGHCTLRAHTPIEARIYGTKGSIYLHPRWHHTERLTITTYEGRETNDEIVALPYEGWGYRYEAIHVMQCLTEGRLESPRVPLQFTLDLSETLDMVAQKAGFPNSL